MKSVIKYSCSICALLAVFALGNYMCYKSALKHFEEMKISLHKILIFIFGN